MYSCWRRRLNTKKFLLNGQYQREEEERTLLSSSCVLQFQGNLAALPFPHLSNMFFFFPQGNFQILILIIELLWAFPLQGGAGWFDGLWLSDAFREYLHPTARVKCWNAQKSLNRATKIWEGESFVHHSKNQFWVWHFKKTLCKLVFICNRPQRQNNFKSKKQFS